MINPTGKSLINMGGIQSGLAANQIFKNFMKSAIFTQDTLLGHIDANGYPTDNTFTSSFKTAFVWTPPSNYTGHYTIAWTGTACRMQQQSTPMTVYSGSSFVVGSPPYSNNTSFTGTNGVIEFDFSWSIASASNNGSGLVRLTFTNSATGQSNSLGNTYIYVNAGGLNGWYQYVSVGSTAIDLLNTTYIGVTTGGTIVFVPQAVNIQFQTTDVPSGFTNLIICRSADLADIQSGDPTRQFNADWLALQTSLGCSVGRFMNSSGVNNGVISRAAYVPPASYISYNSNYYLPRLLVHDNGSGKGIISGTNTLTCAACDDTPGSLTDGESFQGIATNAVTPLTVTGAVSGTGNVIRLTVPSHGLSTGQSVYVSGYFGPGGRNAALQVLVNGNGIWTITVIDANTFELTTGYGGVASVFTQTYVSHGFVYTATINSAARGAVLLSGFGQAADGGAYTIAAGQSTTFVYDALQNCWMVNVGGLVSAMPLATRVAICNKLNIHYWHNLSHLYVTDVTSGTYNSVASETSYIAANLNSNLKCYFEVGNELWNQGFTQCQWSINRSCCFGWPPFNNSYNGLLMRLLYAQTTTTWGGRSGLRRVGAASFQGLAFATTQQFLWEGANLNGTSFPLYAVAGYPNYDTSLANGGNGQPQDFEDDFSYAPYYQSFFGQTGAAGSYNALELSNAKAAADNWASGNTAAALSWIDNDARQGTSQTIAISSVSSGTTFNTATAHGFTTNTLGAFSVAIGGSFYSGGAVQTTPYWVVNTTTNSFQLSLTKNGSAITGVAGGSAVQFGLLGTQTLLYQSSQVLPQFATGAVKYAVPKGLICYEGGYQGVTMYNSQAVSLGVLGTSQTITSASGSTFTLNSHGYTSGQPVMFTTNAPGNGYTGITYSGTISNVYYVVNPTTNTFQVSTVLNGAPAAISGSTGTQTIAISYGGSPASSTRSSGGLFWNLLIGWKLDPTFEATVISQYNSQVASYTATIPGWYGSADTQLSLVAANPWDIFQTDIYGQSQVNIGQAIYFQSFNAIQYFNTH